MRIFERSTGAFIAEITDDKGFQRPMDIQKKLRAFPSPFPNMPLCIVTRMYRNVADMNALNGTRRVLILDDVYPYTDVCEYGSYNSSYIPAETVINYHRSLKGQHPSKARFESIASDEVIFVDLCTNLTEALLLTMDRASYHERALIQLTKVVNDNFNHFLPYKPTVGEESYELIRTTALSGANMDRQCYEEGQTLLHTVSMRDVAAVAAIAMESTDTFQDVSSQADITGNTPLHNTVLYHFPDFFGEYEVQSHLSAELLLGAGADPNVKNDEGLTPLHLAVEMNTPAVLKSLLACPRTDIHAFEENSCNTPLHIAAHQGLEALAQDLLDYGATVNLYPDSRVLYMPRTSSRSKKKSILKDFMGNTIDVDTPLHRVESVALFDILIAAGADVTVKSVPSRRTPLHDAAQNGIEVIVERLLGECVDVNVVDIDGNTPLHAAVEDPTIMSNEVVKKLIVAKANVLVTNEKGQTAYDILKIGATDSATQNNRVVSGQLEESLRILGEAMGAAIKKKEEEEEAIEVSNRAARTAATQRQSRKSSNRLTLTTSVASPTSSNPRNGIKRSKRSREEE